MLRQLSLNEYFHSKCKTLCQWSMGLTSALPQADVYRTCKEHSAKSKGIAYTILQLI